MKNLKNLLNNFLFSSCLTRGSHDFVIMSGKKSNSAFTILELLIVIGIIAIMAAVVLPGTATWTAEGTYKNNYKEIVSTLHEVHDEAQIRNTTTRLIVTKNADIYTLTGFFSPAPVAGCSAAGIWTQLFQRTLETHPLFEITGSGIGDNVCFYRDGSASAGQYNVVQKDAGTDIGSATIDVIISTGFIDVAI